MAGKEQISKNQTEVKALVINAEKVDESKLKDLIESAGKINQSVYTDETVNTLNQAKEEAEETIQGKPMGIPHTHGCMGDFLKEKERK